MHIFGALVVSDHSSKSKIILQISLSFVTLRGKGRNVGYIDWKVSRIFRNEKKSVTDKFIMF
jgi:hypothetical protein